MRPPCCKERAATYAERPVGKALGVGREECTGRYSTPTRAKGWSGRHSVSEAGRKWPGRRSAAEASRKWPERRSAPGTGQGMAGKAFGVRSGPEDGRTAAGRRLSRAAVGATSHMRPPDPGGRRGSHGCPAVRPLRRWPRDRPQKGSPRDLSRNARAGSRRCAVRV